MASFSILYADPDPTAGFSSRRRNAGRRGKSGSPAPRSGWLVKHMNSPSRGSGVTSPAAGMRHLPARRIPASSEEARSALVRLDLPHGLVEGRFARRFEKVGGFRFDWIATRRRTKEH